MEQPSTETSSPVQFNELHVRQFVRYLGHETYSDLRCINVIDGKFVAREIVQGEESIVKFARQYNGKGNVFIGRNPRASNGDIDAITTASFDIDPIRPKGQASTDGQVRASLLGGQRILSRYPSGLIGCSGNGALVLFKVRPVCSREEFKAFEMGLAALGRDLQNTVDDLGVKIDATHDSSRMVKLLGTWSCKGDPSSQRISRIVAIPNPARISESISNEIVRIGSTAGSSRGSIQYPAVGTEIKNAIPDSIRLRQAEDAVKRLPKERCNEYADWLKVGMALKEFGLAGFKIWDQWSRQSEKYDENQTWSKWQSFKDSGEITIGTIVHWANENNSEQPGIPLVSDQSATGIHEFLSDSVSARWICQPFIAREAIGFMAGLPETNKTWLTIDLAIEAARGGGQWAGLFPVEPARVLFIDQERFKGETQRRFKATIRAKGIDPKALSDTLFIQCGTSLKFDDPTSFDAFKRNLERIKPDLIIIDSFATVHSVNENSRMEVQQVMNKVKQVRDEFKCSVLFIDHENKSVFADAENNVAPSAFRMVGSVGKTAAAEFQLTVRKIDATHAAIYHTKSTLASAGEPFTISVLDTVDGGVIIKGTGKESYG